MSDRSVEARHYVFLTFLASLNVLGYVDRELLASFANFVAPAQVEPT
jgi:hypothetical protein